MPDSCGVRPVKTRWLFGTYRGMREELTAPLFSVGFTVASSGGIDCRSGVYVTLGDHGIYLCRSDALKRHMARKIHEAELYANSREGWQP